MRNLTASIDVGQSTLIQELVFLLIKAQDRTVTRSEDQVVERVFLVVNLELILLLLSNHVSSCEVGLVKVGIVVAYIRTSHEALLWIKVRCVEPPKVTGAFATHSSKDESFAQLLEVRVRNY